MEYRNYKEDDRKAKSFNDELRVDDQMDLSNELKDGISSSEHSEDSIIEMREPEYAEHKQQQ